MNRAFCILIKRGNDIIEVFLLNEYEELLTSSVGHKLHSISHVFIIHMLSFPEVEEFSPQLHFVSAEVKREMDTIADTSNAQLKQLNFEDSFRPLYYFSRFTGLWPFSLRHNTNGIIENARIGRLDGAWFLISLSCHLLATYFWYIHIYTKYLEYADANTSADVTIFTFSMLYVLLRMKYLSIGVAGIILDLVNRHRLADILRKFIIFDNEVS